MSSARFRTWRNGLTKKARWDPPNWSKLNQLNWTKKRETCMKSWNTSYSTRRIFPLFGFWSCSGVSLLKACWNMLESLIGCKSRTRRMKGLYIYVHIVLFFTARLQPKVRALQLSSSTIFNYSGIYDMFCHNFLAMPFNAICSCEMCVSTRNIGITAMHFVEWLMRLVRLVWDHGLSWNGTTGRKTWYEFDAVRSSTC